MNKALFLGSIQCNIYFKIQVKLLDIILLRFSGFERITGNRPHLNVLYADGFCQTSWTYKNLPSCWFCTWYWMQDGKLNWLFKDHFLATFISIASRPCNCVISCLALLTLMVLMLWIALQHCFFFKQQYWFSAVISKTCPKILVDTSNFIYWFSAVPSKTCP